MSNNVCGWVRLNCFNFKKKPSLCFFFSFKIMEFYCWLEILEFILLAIFFLKFSILCVYYFFLRIFLPPIPSFHIVLNWEVFFLRYHIISKLCIKWYSNNWMNANFTKSNFQRITVTLIKKSDLFGNWPKNRNS